MALRAPDSSPKTLRATAIQPGSAAFRQFLLARFPRFPSEPLIKGYFSRLLSRPAFRAAGLSPTRLRDLWYGSRFYDLHFKPEEYRLFFDLGPAPGGADDPVAAYPSVFVELKNDLEEARRRQKEQDEKLREGVREQIRGLQKFLSILDENLSKNLSLR